VRFKLDENLPVELLDDLRRRAMTPTDSATRV
jgi:hypothetical protein